MLVDHHCHLDFPQFAAEGDEVVARAGRAGVGVIVTISTRIRQMAPRNASNRIQPCGSAHSLEAVGETSQSSKR